MGSSYFWDPNMESERKASNGGVGRGSRRGKKTGHDKPKQPQRGLGVAQLEKIRLHGQLGVTNFYHPFLLNPYATSTFDQDDVRTHSAAPYSPFPSSPFSYNSPASSSSTASHGYNPHFLMGTDLERGGSIRYDDAVPSSYCPSWIHGRKPSNGAELPRQHIMRPMTPTINLLNFSPEKNNKDDAGGSEDQELDLELRLSR